eukprot:Tbor_TRINITY_DN4140_c0_g1::TRINITY_DN4140_c0_g1_i1::g.26414::m.26414
MQNAKFIRMNKNYRDSAECQMMGKDIEKIAAVPVPESLPNVPGCINGGCVAIVNVHPRSSTPQHAHTGHGIPLAIIAAQDRSIYVVGGVENRKVSSAKLISNLMTPTGSSGSFGTSEIHDKGSIFTDGLHKEQEWLIQSLIAFRLFGDKVGVIVACVPNTHVVETQLDERGTHFEYFSELLFYTTRPLDALAAADGVDSTQRSSFLRRISLQNTHILRLFSFDAESRASFYPDNTPKGVTLLISAVDLRTDTAQLQEIKWPVKKKSSVIIELPPKSFFGAIVAIIDAPICSLAAIFMREVSKADLQCSEELLLATGCIDGTVWLFRGDPESECFAALLHTCVGPISDLKFFTPSTHQKRKELRSEIIDTILNGDSSKRHGYASDKKRRLGVSPDTDCGHDVDEETSILVSGGQDYDSVLSPLWASDEEMNSSSTNDELMLLALDSAGKAFTFQNLYHVWDSDDEKSATMAIIVDVEERVVDQQVSVVNQKPVTESDAHTEQLPPKPQPRTFIGRLTSSRKGLVPKLSQRAGKAFPNERPITPQESDVNPSASSGTYDFSSVTAQQEEGGLFLVDGSSGRVGTCIGRGPCCAAVSDLTDNGKNDILIVTLGRSLLLCTSEQLESAPSPRVMFNSTDFTSNIQEQRTTITHQYYVRRVMDIFCHMYFIGCIDFHGDGDKVTLMCGPTQVAIQPSQLPSDSDVRFRRRVDILKCLLKVNTEEG